MANYYWIGGTGDFGAASSWDVAITNEFGTTILWPANLDYTYIISPGTIGTLYHAGPPPANSSDLIDTGGVVTGSGVAARLQIDSDVSIDATTTAPVYIGQTAPATVSVNGGEWHSGSLQVGYATLGTLEVTNAGSVFVPALFVGQSEISKVPNLVTVDNGLLSSIATIEVDTGTLSVSDGGVVSAGGNLSIFPGSRQAAELFVMNGGTVVAQNVFAVGGGVLSVMNGGTLSSNPGGSINLQQFGTLSVAAGGQVSTTALKIGGGAAPSTVLDEGGNFTISGSVSLSPGAHFSGYGTVSADISNGGSIIAANATEILTLTGSVIGTGFMTIASGAELILDGSISSTQTIIFQAPSASIGGTLGIGATAGFASAIDGFQAGDTIDVSGVVADSVVYDAASGNFLLEKDDPVVLGALDLIGLVPTTQLSAQPDGHGGTDITFTTTQQAVDLGYAVWGGGSGEISAFNWISGYVESVTNGVASFEGWIYGPAPVASSSLSIQATLRALGQTNTDVGDVGTLSGNLSTSDNLNFGLTSGSTDILTGNLAVSDADITSGSLTVDGNTAVLTVGGLLKVEGGQLSTDDGGAVSAFAGFYVGYDTSGGGTILAPDAAVMLSGTGSTLDDAADFYLGGTLDVIHAAQATFAGSVNLFGQSSLTVDPTAEMEIGGSGNLSNGIIVVDAGHSISGSGEITGSIDNNGQIIASNPNETLTLNGDIGGNGVEIIDDNSTLEINGVVDVGQTISFDGSSGTLVLDDPASFLGTIENVDVGDTIVLANTGFATSNGVVAATIGTLGGIQGLQTIEKPTPNRTSLVNLPYVNIPVTAIGAAPYAASNYYFGVTQSVTDTNLTLQQGNPIALSVGAPTVWQEFGVEGAGVKIGVISDSVNALGGALPNNVTILPGFAGLTQGATDEGGAMVQVIQDIAPDASIEFATGLNSSHLVDQTVMSAAIQGLIAAGCNIIVDDVIFNTIGEADTGTPVETAINSAFGSGVSYITAAGNNGSTSIFGHATDADALTVAAMNILATPSSVGGYITPWQTEGFDSTSTTTGKPNITGPDGGATSFSLSSGLSPFFGTSAAAPAVAAVAALMMSENHSLTPSVVYQLLEGSAFKFGEPSSEMGAGFVQAPQAVALAADFVQCFVEGTRILCENGETVVEQLHVGDLIWAQYGGLSPIKRIVRRYVVCSECANPKNVWPVKISAHAFGDNVPSRNLSLSPNHAVVVCNKLIPIRYLINGTTVVQMPASEVAYYHIGLSDHDVITAEGMLVETFLDMGDHERVHIGSGNLPNWNSFHAGAMWETHSCMPIVISGAFLNAARLLVSDRAAKLLNVISSLV